MHASVEREFFPFTDKFEGTVRSMYLDVKGNVSTGMGILLETPNEARGYPWLRPDGSRASPSEITAEWEEVHKRQDMAHSSWTEFERFTKLRLTPEYVRDLTARTAREFETTLRSYFPTWDSLPADAQLGILSLAWANGPHFPGNQPHGFPKFRQAVNERDFERAALESHMDETGVSALNKRNRANFILLNNAHAVERDKLEPSVLYWPKDLLGTPYPFDGGGSDGSFTSAVSVATAIAQTPSGRRDVFKRALGTIGMLGGLGGIGYLIWRRYSP
jgi:hypothetical protein